MMIKNFHIILRAFDNSYHSLSTNSVDEALFRNGWISIVVFVFQ